MQRLLDFQQQFATALQQFWSQTEKEASQLSQSQQQLYQEIKRLSLAGGKRTRSAMLYYSYQGFASKNLNTILQASIALELMQTSLLIHDDIMDEAALRRGEPTIHYTYTTSIKKGKGNSQYHPNRAQRYGESVAILAGTIAGYLGSRLLKKLELPVQVKLDAIDLYNDVMISTGLGQLIDLDFSFSSEATEDELLQLHQQKTARYSAEMPLELGAILAEQDKNVRQQMRNIGSPLGLAFQLYDDYLGLFGDEETMGKSALTDLKEGKQTLLIIKARELGNEQQRKSLNSLLGKADITTQELQQAQTIVQATGSLDYCQQKMLKLMKQAEEQLDQANLQPAGHTALVEMINYILRRAS